MYASGADESRVPIAILPALLILSSVADDCADALPAAVIAATANPRISKYFFIPAAPQCKAKVNAIVRTRAPETGRCIPASAVVTAQRPAGAFRLSRRFAA